MPPLIVEPASASSYYWTRSHAIGGNIAGRQTPLQQPIATTTETEGEAATSTAKLENAAEEARPAAVPPQPDPRRIMMPVCPALQTDEYKAELAAGKHNGVSGGELAAEDAGELRPLSASGHPACQLCGVGIV